MGVGLAWFVRPVDRLVLDLAAGADRDVGGVCVFHQAAFFAVVKIGGIVLPLFSGYGVDAVTTRLQDAGVKALITADGFWRRGQPVRMKDTADAAVASVSSVEQVIVARRIGIDIRMGSRDHWWNDLVTGQPDSCPTEHTGADDVPDHD